MKELTRAQKHSIRKRDAKKIKLTGVCSRCGETAKTTRHHLWYDPDRFCREAVMEVCDTCDNKIHGRNENDRWVKELRTIQTIELVRDTNNTSEYIIKCNEKIVGHTHSTVNGIKLAISHS